MASAELRRRVEKVVGYPPLSEIREGQRREFHEALLDAGRFEDLPGKWQAAILQAEQTGRSCGSSWATESEETRECLRAVHSQREQLVRALRVRSDLPR